MKKITLLILLITSIGFSQTNPIDFETAGNGASWEWFVFENDTPALEFVENPNTTGNTSATVAKITVKQGGANYAGTRTDDQGTFDLSEENSTVRIWVYKTVISDVGIKFEQGAASTGEFKVANTKINEWEEIIFDMSPKIGEAQSTGITGVVVFPDFAARTQDNIIYFDNITFSPKSSLPVTTALPIDFETATTWGDFNGGVVTTETNPFNNADNTSANVGKMVKSAGEVYGGSSLVLSAPIDFANNDTFTMKVYSPRVGAKVLLKVENSEDAGVNFEKEVLTTVANAWETLTFDYAAISKTDAYDKLVLIFDNGTQGDGSANFTFYLDDIAISKSGESSVTIALPIDFETATTWGDFNGGVVTTETNPFNNADNTSANVGKMVKSAGEVYGGSSLVLSAPIDFANNDTFTMKVYSPRVGAKVLLKVENSGDAGVNFEKEVLTTVANAWETLTFDYAAISKTAAYDKLVLIFDNGTQGDGSANFTFYMDDIIVSSSATASVGDNKLLNVSMYPNPTSSRLTISAQSTIKSAAVYNLLGKQVMSLKINKNSESIDVSNLATGMYLIKYTIGNAVGTAKFIKQ
jgi:hypothetical protein